MIKADRIFKIGARHIHVYLWVYASDANVRRATKEGNIRGLCRKYEKDLFHIIISRRAFVDGTLEHEIQHIVQMCGIKRHEKQAEIVEQITPWARGLINDHNAAH